jgi:hypothetical protein
MRFPTPSIHFEVPGGQALSHYEKAEVMAKSLEAQLQSVNNQSEPAVIEIVNEAMRTYEYAPNRNLLIFSRSYRKSADPRLASLRANTRDLSH